MPHHHPDTQRFGLSHQRAVLCWHTGIQNGRHVQPCMFDRNGRAVGIVVVGHNNRPVRH